MYPFLRMGAEWLRVRRAPPIELFETHVTRVTCLPWDLDMFLEMNNGRILTLYDLGRMGLGWRSPFFGVLRKRRWGLTVAGSSVRYRARVRIFDRLEMRTRFVGWDARFLYMEQSLWRGEICTSHLLIRAAITDAGGLVQADRFGPALDLPPEPAPLPDWISGWVAADAGRPWPPMQDADAGARDRRAA